MNSSLAKIASRFYGQVMSDLFPSALDDVLQWVENQGWQIDPPEAYCPRCGASAGEGGVTDDGCAFCIQRYVPWRRLVRLAAYQPPMNQWIRSMKFGSHWSWATWLGRLLAQVVPEPVPADHTAVCPVPMHWLRRWRRGFNQAHLIAAAVADQKQWLLAPVLRRIQYTPPQTAVAPSQRVANIRGSFAADRIDLSGWAVILIDDVKTTGATLSACTRLLKQAGACCVTVAVAAVADPKGIAFKAI